MGSRGIASERGGLICDLGNVIIAYWLSSISLESFDTIDYAAIPEVPDAFEFLRRFGSLFSGNVTVVYNATDVAAEKISRWFLHHRFSERTGIPSNRVVHSKGGRDKTAYLEQSSSRFFGTTIVIDDRLEVLSQFVGKVPYLFLFRPQKDEIEQFKSTGALEHVKVVQTWAEIWQLIQRPSADL